jgi:transcriptional/translational regulatory protein YebC/TACO1
MTLVLDAGAEDLKTDKVDVYEVVTPPESFDKVKKALEEKKIATESAEVTFIPKTTVVLDESKAGSVLELYDALDEYEDVQNVHANFEISDEIMAKLDK